MEHPLINSRRSARTSTYTPIHFTEVVGAAGDGGDVINTAGLIRSVGIVPAELDELSTQATTDEARGAARAIASLVHAATSDQVMHAAAGLAAVPRRGIVAALERVRAVRTAVLASATAALNAPPTAAPPPPADGHVTIPTPATTIEPDARFSASVFAAARFKSALTPAIALDVGSTPSVVAFRSRFAAHTSLAQQKPAALPTTGASPIPPAAMQAMRAMSKEIIVGNGINVHGTYFIAIIAPYVPPGTDLATIDPIDALEEIDRKVGAVNIVIDALARRNVQPLGLLHLEELEMTPKEMQRGELLYSLPLAPKEKVTLSHKEWAVRESDFTEFVQDSIENYSERGVAETDEIAMSSQSESRKTERTGMGTGGGVVLSGAAEAGSTVVTNSHSRQDSATHAKSITSRASSRSVRDHKVSFTVATVAGTEDFTSRLIENPNADRVMRIDYFRRMKSWDVELYRTGVRLAYDVVIPDPGRRLRLRQDLVRQYDRALAGSFKPGLNPAEIDRTTWMDYASAYGVALPAPPMDPETSTVYKQWQVNVFAALRDAAYAKYSLVQESLRQRRSELSRQIDSAADADTLRQMEREEIVRLTLAWIVPGFPGSAGTPGSIGAPQGLSDASWQQALEFGEYIKFVHAAIDWGRLTYFLCPYFWSDRQVDRLFLRHSDLAHRDFLRAGAARVVVPIAPGFEEELTAFIDLGRIGKLPGGHRFGEVIAAVRQANAGLTIDTSTELDVTRRRTLIGKWTEFTPTGALDIGVVTSPVEDL